MKLFLVSSSKSTTNKRGYYGGVDFPDNQDKFKAAFGDSPTLLSARPNDNQIQTFRKSLKYYIKKCTFDVFMHLCMLGYIGHDKVDKSLNVQEVCRQIGTIKQVWSKLGKVYTDTPDELYDKLTSISVSLLNDATTWSINLCSSYLAALTSELSEAITSEKTFNMPRLTDLTTKSPRLEAL